MPGHTRGHIAYWFAGSDALFCGDTLFLLGCGRLFEGTPAQMWTSLGKLRALPDSANVYCAHEYTQANARFAVTVDPQNADLTARAAEIDRMRAAGIATVPGRLGVEKRTNPVPARRRRRRRCRGRPRRRLAGRGLRRGPAAQGRVPGLTRPFP